MQERLSSIITEPVADVIFYVGTAFFVLAFMLAIGMAIIWFTTATFSLADNAFPLAALVISITLLIRALRAERKTKEYSRIALDALEEMRRYSD